jgi:predicted O-methyltransferase YrrM
MYGKIKFVLKYTQHYFHARSKFDLHSPFIYKIYSQILKDKTVYPEYRVMKKLWSSLLQDQRYTRRTDFGAKAPDFPWQKKILHVKTIAKRFSVSPGNGRLLFRLSRHFRPKIILELGTSLGISAAYMALGNPEGKVITVEGCPEVFLEAEMNFERLGIRNIDQRTGNFDQVLPEILNELKHLDMIFIDGNHKKDATLNYFQQCLQHIDSNSVLIFDDIHWSEGMEEAWLEIKHHPRVKITIDLFQMGLVFFRDELSKEDFILRF